MSLSETLTKVVIFGLTIPYALSGSSTTPRGIEVRSDQKTNTTLIRVPVRCDSFPSCGDDLSLDQARSSYRERRNFPKPAILQTLTDYNQCDSIATSNYYWAPIERYSDGEQSLQVLLVRARYGRPFNGFVIAESDESTDSEQHLALCSVSMVGEAVGPPRDCTTVAIITATETWLRGGSRNVLCKVGATYRNSGAIDITFDVRTKIDSLVMSNALMETLKANFDLSVEREVIRELDGRVHSIFLKSVGSLRNSKILQKGWREALDFDLIITPTTQQIAIRGVARALVCRQALGSIVHYTGLDDAQRATYGSALDSGVNTAIRSVCKSYEQLDAKTIICKQ
jgi:hypothetical protein